MTPQALLLCPILGALALVLAVRGMPGRERNIMIAGFLAHVAASIALVLYHETSGGDMTVYRFYGAQIARALDIDFIRYAPEVVRLALHRESSLPFPVLLEGTSSGTMSAYAGMLIFLVGDTTFGTCLLVAFFSYAGMMSMYRALRESLEERERMALLGALLFMPSATFWTSGIVKEAFLMGYLGFLLGAAYDVLARRRMLRLPLGAFGAIGVSITKPYVMFPLVIATAGYLFARRGRKLSFGYKVGAVIVAVGGVIGASRLFPQFGLDNLGEAIATQQRNGVLVANYAGSYISVGDEDVQTLGGQLRFLPLGATALPDAGFACLVAGLAAALYAVVFGLAQRDVRRQRAHERASELSGSDKARRPPNTGDDQLTRHRRSFALRLLQVGEQRSHVVPAAQRAMHSENRRHEPRRERERRRRLDRARDDSLRLAEESAFTKRASMQRATLDGRNRRQIEPARVGIAPFEKRLQRAVAAQRPRSRPQLVAREAVAAHDVAEVGDVVRLDLPLVRAPAALQNQSDEQHVGGAELANVDSIPVAATRLLPRGGGDALLHGVPRQHDVQNAARHVDARVPAQAVQTESVCAPAEAPIEAE